MINIEHNKKVDNLKAKMMEKGIKTFFSSK